MTKVLIAADDTETSVDAARHAHRLFGDDAEYLVVNVDRTNPNQYGWGYAYPVMMPMPYAVPPMVATPPTGSGEHLHPSAEQAEERAEEVVAAARLDGAEVVGDVGDPADAILDAAREHQVDVIVVGSHERSWVARLFGGSVGKDVLRDADVPVLVVK